MGARQRPRSKTWTERRPVACCQLGVLHAFGPGRLQENNHQLEFLGSGERRLRVPVRELACVFVYGPVRVTSRALRLIAEAGSGLAYLSANGSRTLATLLPPTDPWRNRRYRQYRATADLSWRAVQARQVIADKLLGMEEAIAYARRQGRCGPEARQFLADLPGHRAQVAAAANLESLRGFEGIASRRWFAILDQLLPEGWTMSGRHKRPPTDPVNALLSFGYTLLFHRVQAACLGWGLDAALGFYHEFRPGRASLACDLMEPFRVPAVDRLVIRLLSQRRYTLGEFRRNEGDQSVRLTEDALKRWVDDLESHIHTPDAQGLSLQVRIVDRVRHFAENLSPINEKSSTAGSAARDSVDSAEADPFVDPYGEDLPPDA